MTNTIAKEKGIAEEEAAGEEEQQEEGGDPEWLGSKWAGGLYQTQVPTQRSYISVKQNRRP